MLWISLIVFSCTRPSETTPQEALASASEDVIFASVEKLGAHSYEAILERVEREGERELSFQKKFYGWHGKIGTIFIFADRSIKK